MRPAATVAAASAISVLGFLAPSPGMALTVTAPLQALPTGNLITSSPVTLSFKGFNSTNFPGLSGYDLQKVTLTTISGKTGGSFDVTNFNPTASVTVASPGQFKLSANGSSLALFNDNATGVVGPALTSPTYTPTTGTFTITQQTQSFSFDLARAVGDPFGALNPGTLPNFTVLNLNLPTSAGYIAAAPGGSSSDAGSTYELDTLLSNTFLTYQYVPGPLPILGAGAAFGWSRRLRKRIAKTA